MTDACDHGLLKQWRARFGMIHPRICCDMEIYDFYQVAPRDVVLVTTHLEIEDSGRREEVEASLALAERAVERLSGAGVDMILKNGLPILMYRGVAGHDDLLRRMQAVSRVPVTTAALACVDAFKALSVGKILLISSWRAEAASFLIDSFRAFLSRGGVEVAKTEGIGGQFHSHEKHRLVPAVLFDHIVATCRKHPGVEGIFIQSGTLATVGMIEALEQAIGKPVVSSNNSIAWAYFKTLGIQVGRGHGALMAAL
jgi:maleate isomerase